MVEAIGRLLASRGFPATRVNIFACLGQCTQDEFDAAGKLLVEDIQTLCSMYIDSATNCTTR